MNPPYLEEEYEAHPLIVGVVDTVVLAWVGCLHPRVGDASVAHTIKI